MCATRSMHLLVSLFLGLLYVSSFHAASAAEYLPQFDILTKQRPIQPSQQHSYRLDEITIDQLHGLFEDGSLTSEVLVDARASPMPHVAAATDVQRPISSGPRRSMRSSMPLAR